MVNNNYTKRVFKKSIKISSKNNKSIKISSKNNKRGGTVLGYGKDGCVVDSLVYNNYTKENGYVAKILSNNENKIHDDATEIMAILKEIDPDEKRYLQSILVGPSNSPFFSDQFDTNIDIKECKKKGILNDKTSIVFFMHKLEPFDTQKMTKEQYRYLRDSIDLLIKNNILHGDLPGNVMLDANNNPIIIDWENATLNPSLSILKTMDKNTFLNSGYFKINKN